MSFLDPRNWFFRTGPFRIVLPIIVGVYGFFIWHWMQDLRFRQDITAVEIKRSIDALRATPSPGPHERLRQNLLKPPFN